jgi:hypothetical protein
MRKLYSFLFWRVDVVTSPLCGVDAFFSEKSDDQARKLMGPIMARCDVSDRGNRGVAEILAMQASSVGAFQLGRSCASCRQTGCLLHPDDGRVMSIAEQALRSVSAPSTALVGAPAIGDRSVERRIDLHRVEPEGVSLEVTAFDRKRRRMS